MVMTTTSIIPFLLPVPFLFVVLIALLWGETGKRNIGYIGAFAGLVTLFLGIQSWGLQGTVATTPWFSITGTLFSWSVMIDNLSLLLTMIIAGIGVFIFLYSVGYFEPNEDLRRYYAELSLFAAAMIGVVTAANLFQLFFAWELVGVSSYLLIGFWHEKESAIAAARKAFITIIIGDAFLLAGIFLLWIQYHTFDIPIILELVRSTPMTTMTVMAGIGIIIGAISKSAQFPLHTWLPDAMEGPTPVSAFLHSAAMVKAGLFLIARMLPLLALAGLSPLLVLLAVITIIISAGCALVENDIKRVLAYSTMNHLAFIMLAFGIGSVATGLYHLLNHSIFKALLFMSAGVIIHKTGTQDITKMHMPFGWNILFISTLLGVLALAGIPPFAGFFSKDALFEAVVATGNNALLLVFALAILASSAYIFRWFFLIFKKKKHEHENTCERDMSAVSHTSTENYATKHTTTMIEHTPPIMQIPLPILALLALVGGLWMSWFYGWWTSDTPHIGLASFGALLLALCGALIAFSAYYRKTLSVQQLSITPVALFFKRKFLLDDLGDIAALIVKKIGRASMWVDDCIINRFLIFLTEFFAELANILRLMITGRPTTYVLAVVLGFLLLALAVRVS